MRMKLFFAAILISGLLFSTGCQKIKSLADVNISADYTIDLNLTVLQKAFKGSTTIDPSTNSQVSKYLKLIKHWKVDNINGSFKNVSKPAILKTGTITFSSNAGTATWTVTNLKIINGGVFSLDNAQGQWDKVAQILSTKKPFTISIKGTTDTDGFTFTMSLKIETTFTANPFGTN